MADKEKNVAKVAKEDNHIALEAYEEHRLSNSAQ